MKDEGGRVVTKVTQILTAVQGGDRKAAEQLLPLVYDELRRLAASKLAREKAGQTLEPTALVHEAWLRLVGESSGAGREASWDSRGHFFAAAAEAMRRILIDNARKKGRKKRGGKLQRLDLDAASLATTATPDQLLAVDEALEALAKEDASAAQLVHLRMYTGLSIDDAGKAIGVSKATAYRHWNYARAWLFSRLFGDEE